jgi:signal transduction histidine kinase/DNA-binding response OmpR family regulator/PAS domain-containing protein
MHQKSDGTPLPAEITLVRVNYGSGYVLAGYTRDLSRRKALEKSVAEANERTKILLDSTPLCCQLWDDSFRKIDCNEEAIRLFGFKDKQDFLEGHSVLYPEYQPDGQLSVEKAKMYVKQAFTEGYCTFGWTYKLSDGSLLPAQVVLVKVKREDGFVIAGYTRDMREHNKMMKDIEYRDCLLRAVNQAAALLNNSEIESFADNLHQSMKILSEAVDVERVYIWENYTIDSQLYCRQIYEWSENAEPQQDKEFASGIPYSGYISRWGEILPTGKCVNGIVRELSEEEQALLSPQCIISIMVVPIFIKDIFWGFVGFDDCINERIFTEEEEAALRSGGLLFTNALIRNELIKNIHKTSAQLEKALQQANASSKAKGDFLSNMSHEMRTPMNAIIGMTAIGKNANDIEQKNHALNKIGDASSHLLGVINDVLDMAKIEADKLELSPIEYNFERMLQKVVTVISFRVDEKRQSLSVNVEKNIPRFVVGDDQRLAQVITNLLSNAVKFTPEEGSIRLEAFFVGEANGICDLRIEVTDSGIGIASDQHQKIFQSFEQAESGTSRQYGGTGLGLVISKRIVELMEGNIWLESEPGKGSKFSFTVKIGRGKKSPGSLLAPGVNWENIRILVVDDIIETCTQFKDIFSNLGIQCDTALDGQEAWNIIEEHGEYDIYFIDWRMPVMDGIELTRRIKSLKESRPSVVTMITAADWQQIKGEAFEAGVDKYLLKPLFSSMIIDCVNECLGTVQSKDDDTTVGEGEFAGKRILVAEDIEINREILIALLENTGLMIDCAENGKEALTMVASAPEKYDMVFMDIQMPQMDGLEATRCIRALPEHKRNKLPIVAMTANVFQSDIDACHEAGMDGHLGKPLDIDNVLEKLRMYLKAKKD